MRGELGKGSCILKSLMCYIQELGLYVRFMRFTEEF